MLRKTLLALATLACCGAGARDARARDLDPSSQADNFAKVWLRLDADRVGLSAWAGSTLSTGALNLAYNVVVTQAYPGVVDPMQDATFSAKVGDDYRAPTARLELGPAFSTGGLFLLPKIGLGYDFERKKLGPLVPQLMTIVEGGPLYVESWAQFFLYDLFDDGSQDSFYTRDMVLVALNNTWAVGPQVELTVAMQNSPGKALRSLPLGAAVNLSPVEALTFGLFAGFETQKVARNAKHDSLAGRLTATLLW
jgi:hypothetical protein